MRYPQTEQSVADLADGIEEMARIMEGQLSLNDPAQRLRERAEQIRGDRFRVLVVGEFKRGKSTLLNAMLGKDILPRRVVECTAVVTLIEYRETAGVRVVFNDGQPDEHCTIEQFRANYELQIEDADQRHAEFDRFTRVDHAMLSYPVDICRNRIELVDTPGLGAHNTRTQRTQKFLPKADAVVLVLGAMQFLRIEEQHFLENVLLPLGLKNIFFVINGWNLIDEATLDSEAADAERANLEALIQQHLKPFCVVNGVDCSEQRIFRVNALGALKARSSAPVRQSMLEESQVPAFEEALRKFLVEERGRVRAGVTLAAVENVSDEVTRFIATQLNFSKESLQSIEQEHAALQPKLERLRGIRHHIEGFLDTQSATLQDRLSHSFQEQIRRIDVALPEVVNKFNLEELTRGSMLWKAISDWARDDENKYKAQVERHIVPQVQRYLETEFAKWFESVRNNELKAVAVDVTTHLQQEAAEYQRVIGEIEARLGIKSNRLMIDELVDRWLGKDQSTRDERYFTFEGAGAGTLGDMSFLVVGIATDLVAEILLHLSTAWVPVLGILVTGFRLAMREKNIRDEMRVKLVQGIREKLHEIKDSRTNSMREQIKADFSELKSKVTGNISEEIALLDASLEEIIMRKQKTEFSAQEEQQRLEDVRTRFDEAALRIRALII